MLKNNFIFNQLSNNLYLAISRRFKILSYIFIDFVSLSVLFLITQKNYSSWDLNFSFIFFWVIYSYFLGRYYFKYKNYRDLLFKFILISVAITSISVISIIMINYIVNYPEFTYFINRLNLILIALISFFSNIVILFFNTNRSAGKENWLIYNDKNKTFENFKIFLDELSNSSFSCINNLDNVCEYDKKINGIIVFNINELDISTINSLLTLQIKGIEIFDPFLWCKKNLLRYPVEIIMNSGTYLDFNKVQASIFSRIKRIFDITFSAFLFLLTLPIIALSCLIIFLEDKGPVFYSQKRTGYKGKVFYIWKIRSMKMNSEPNGPVWTSRNDTRTLKFGQFLRNTRIDELPQLISVISGDMSLIGPRPERPELEVNLIEKLPNYMYRYQVKPGLSGWAQINYPYGASIEDSKNKLSYDFFYILEYSFFLDILIFIKTIRIIIRGSGSKPK